MYPFLSVPSASHHSSLQSMPVCLAFCMGLAQKLYSVRNGTFHHSD